MAVRAVESRYVGDEGRYVWWCSLAGKRATNWTYLVERPCSQERMLKGANRPAQIGLVANY